MTTLREFAEHVLFAKRLEDKLTAPPPGLVDDARGPALVTPLAPGRPPGLQLSRAGEERADFPREHQLIHEQARGHLLHFMANHELLAKRVRESVTLVTALNPIIGYEKSALIAKTALATGKPIGEVAESLGIMTARELEALLVPDKLTQPI